MFHSTGIFLRPLLIHSTYHLEELCQFLMACKALHTFQFSLIAQFQMSVFRLTQKSFFHQTPHQACRFISGYVHFSGILFRCDLSALPPCPIDIFQKIFFQFASGFCHINISVFNLLYHFTFPTCLFYIFVRYTISGIFCKSLPSSKHIVFFLEPFFFSATPPDYR